MNENTPYYVEQLSRLILGEKIPYEVRDVETKEILIQPNVKITKTMIKRVCARREHVDMDPSMLRRIILRTLDQPW